MAVAAGPALVVSDRTLRWVLRATLAAPFLVALIVLAGHHWSPVLDLAMTEFRVRDVGGAHTPLIGLPGRIGHFPDQGSHPGPLSFYLLTPTYRLLGSTAYGLLAGTAVVNVAATWTALWAAARQGGRRLAVGVAAMLAVALAWFGASILTQPWNPYLPLASFAVVLLAGWAVLDGDHRMLVFAEDVGLRPEWVPPVRIADRNPIALGVEAIAVASLVGDGRVVSLFDEALEHGVGDFEAIDPKGVELHLMLRHLVRSRLGIARR